MPSKTKTAGLKARTRPPAQAGQAKARPAKAGPAKSRPARAKPPAAEASPATRRPAAKAPRAAARQSAPPALQVVLAALEDMKAIDVKTFDVRGLTDVADYMVIASGTSDRHVRSVAQRVVEKSKEAGLRPHGVEGQQDGNWVLIDLSDLIVHVMLPRSREHYSLEKLWDLSEAKRGARP